MTSQITLRLQHRYPGFALDLDLQLPGKGVTALYGHSGSGKTTCLRCIAGLERASQAFVQVKTRVAVLQAKSDLRRHLQLQLVWALRLEYNASSTRKENTTMAPASQCA